MQEMGDTYSPLIGGQTGSINMKNQCGNSNNKIKVKAKTNKKPRNKTTI